MRWILLVLLALMLPVQVQAAKAKRPKRNRAASSAPYIGKPVFRHLARQGNKDGVYQGYLMHRRERDKSVSTYAVFADCQEETICVYLENGTCYSDSDWMYFAPNTIGGQIYGLVCDVSGILQDDD